MKCKKCGQKAVLGMPEHTLSLCKEHFLEWLPEQVERSIKRYGMFTRDEKILVAVSGGKDSLSLWEILQRLGYRADGMYISLGIDGGVGYSTESHTLSEQFAKERGLTLHVVDVRAVTGKSLPEWVKLTRRGHEKPCSLCGLIKRHEMNRMARDLGYDVLATGHNLDDEAAVLFGNTLTWAGDYLLRQGPTLPGANGLAKKVKPLCRIYEREMTAYAILRNIQYIYEECPYSVGAKSIFYKELLNKLENVRPGAKLAYYLNFLDAKEKGLFAPQQTIRPDMHACASCGQPTSAESICSYCRMLLT